MNQYDSILKTYADAGLRTEEDWSLAGRDIVDGSKARTSAARRGTLVDLFTRDQTHAHIKAEKATVL
jgi:hypothetical protein